VSAVNSPRVKTSLVQSSAAGLGEDNPRLAPPRSVTDANFNAAPRNVSGFHGSLYVKKSPHRGRGLSMSA
jgi:hypothetical protein